MEDFSQSPIESIYNQGINSSGMRTYQRPLIAYIIGRAMVFRIVASVHNYVASVKTTVWRRL